MDAAAAPKANRESQVGIGRFTILFDQPPQTIPVPRGSISGIERMFTTLLNKVKIKGSKTGFQFWKAYIFGRPTFVGGSAKAQ